MPDIFISSPPVEESKPEILISEKTLLPTHVEKSLKNGHSRTEERISVNPVVSEVASWYEKARMSMEYAEDEVLFRSATERILKRHLFLIKVGHDIAPSLVRELSWAKYIPSGTIPQSILTRIAERIDIYLKLNEKTKNQTQIGVPEYIIQLLSADLALLLLKNPERDQVAEMFLKVLKGKVSIEGVGEEDEGALLLINLFRSLSREDQPYLRHRLLNYYYGELNIDSLEKYIEVYPEAVKKVEWVLINPLNNKLFSYTKRNSAPFLILEDIIRKHGDKFEELTRDRDKLNEVVLIECEERYKELGQKIRRAVIRGVIFLFLTKTVIALFIEGTFERLIFGEVVWEAIALNTIFPPLLLFTSLFFIDTPDHRNSEKIARAIESVLFEENATKIEDFGARAGENSNRYVQSIFFALWLSIGIIMLVVVHLLLDLVHLNIISQGIFIFFLAIVLFLIYRIRESARAYNIGEEKTRLISFIFDLLFIPFVYIGRRLTLTVQKFNVVMIIFDLIIETPFKTLFLFFEQWLFFLRSQREKLE